MREARRKLTRAVARLLPSKWVHGISTYRRHRSAAHYHARMEAIGQELDPDLQRDLRVLPTRLDLLDALPKGTVVAEVGVAGGEFSLQILRRCRPRRLHLIDRWQSGIPEYSEQALDLLRERLSSAVAEGTVHFNRGCSWEVLAAFPRRYFDWIYIDAAHDYDSVMKDLRAAHGCIADAGYICGHDYVLWSGVGLSRFGVVEAVNEFCNRERYALKYITNQRNRHLSYALQRLP